VKPDSLGQRIENREEGHSTRFYRPELDGLRFAAFLAVFVHHWLPNTPEEWDRLGPGAAMAAAIVVRTGAYGVDFFFVLSSYLLSELLLREKARTGKIDPLRFYMRRLLRIWPLYFVFLAGTALIAPHFLDDSLSGHGLAFVFFVSNWTAAFTGSAASVAAPLWSVSVEEQFYLIKPWLVRHITSVGWWRLVGALTGLALLTRAVLVLNHAQHPGIWCNTFARLDTVAMGIVLALAQRNAPWVCRALRRVGVVGGALIILGIGACVRLDQSPPPWPLLLSYSAVAFGAGSIIAGTMGGGLSQRVFSNALVAWLGRISYGLYVFHALGLVLGRRQAVSWDLVDAPRVLLTGLVGLGLTIAASVLSWFLVERPFLRLKKRYEVVASRPT
jgi:peptidoglycan/LPS O-acetylase OafA/YrhL